MCQNNLMEKMVLERLNKCVCVCGGGGGGGRNGEEEMGGRDLVTTSHHIKIYLSRRIDLDLKYRTLKFLEEKNRKIFSWSWYRQTVFRKGMESVNHKGEKNNKLNSTNIKDHWENKMQVTDWEKIFTICIFDKGDLSYIKNSFKLIIIKRLTTQK